MMYCPSKGKIIENNCHRIILTILLTNGSLFYENMKGIYMSIYISSDVFIIVCISKDKYM